MVPTYTGDADCEVNGRSIRVYSLITTTRAGVRPRQSLTASAGVTYVFSANVDKITKGAPSIGIRNATTGAYVTRKEQTTAGKVSVVYTPTEDVQIHLCLLSTSSTEADGDVTFSDVQFEIGSAATEWEPYTGGIPSPNPEYPQELESVGADGNVAVTVCGKNLFALKDYKTTSDFITRETKNGVLKVVVVNERGGLLTVIVSAFISASFVGTNNFPAGTYTYNGAARVVQSGISNNENTRVHLILADGTSTTIDHGTTKTIAQGFSVEKITFMSGTLDLRLNDTVTLLPILESGNSAIQTLTAQTPNGLPGIPVSSGGNYIDENGQRWVCDEIDFARGKYVKRIGTKTFKGTEAFTQISSNLNCWRVVVPEMWTETAGGSDFNTVLALSCSHFKPVRYKSASQAEDRTVTFYSTGEHIIRFTHNSKAVPDYIAEQYAAGNPVKVLYKLAVPTETDLTAEELAQYSALHTNYPTTTIYNDKDAGMELTYYTPTTAVQMVHSPADKGKILSID